MKTRHRNILIIVLGCFLITGGLAAYGGYRIYSWLSSAFPSREIPADLQQARVLKGQEFLKKTQFFKLNYEGTLSVMKKAVGIKDEKERQRFIQSETAKGIFSFSDLKIIGPDLVAVGEFGAYIFDLNGNLRRNVPFELTEDKIRIGRYEQKSYALMLSNIRIVPLGSSRYGFLSFGATQGVLIFDDTGHRIWTYGKEEINVSSLLQNEKERQAAYEKSTHVLEAAVGDLDGDGVSEYIVARKSDGIRAFDREGREKWFQPDDFPSEPLEVRDLNGDGKNEIIKVGKAVCNGDGTLLRETKSSSGDTVLFVTGKDKKITLQYCGVYHLSLTCNGETGNAIFSSPAPLSDVKLEKPRTIEVPGSDPITFDSESTGKLAAAWIRLEKDKPSYLAVVASFIGIPRANLYVYDSTGALQYHELLPESAETILVVPGDGGVEQLLVGGKDTIWKYGH